MGDVVLSEIFCVTSFPGLATQQRLDLSDKPHGGLEGIPGLLVGDPPPWPSHGHVAVKIDVPRFPQPVQLDLAEMQELGGAGASPGMPSRIVTVDHLYQVSGGRLDGLVG